MVQFSMTLNDPKPRFQECALTLNISETVQNRDSYNAILIGTYTCPTQRYNLCEERCSKFSMTWSCIWLRFRNFTGMLFIQPGAPQNRISFIRMVAEIFATVTLFK